MEEVKILSVLSCDRYLTLVEIGKLSGLSITHIQQCLNRLQSNEQIQIRHFAGRDYFRITESSEHALTDLGRAANRYLVNRQAARKIGQARTCYHHLAGNAGVALFSLLLTHNFIERSGVNRYLLTECGRQDLENFLNCPIHQSVVRTCIDFSERRLHLSGTIGNELFQKMVSDHILSLNEGRKVSVNKPLSKWVMEVANDK